VSGPTTTTLNVTPNINGNGNTVVAIQETNSLNYVQSADGTLGATADWQTTNTWSTVTVTGLSAHSGYAFRTKARNGDNVQTGFGPVTTMSTADTSPVAYATTNTVAQGGSVSIVNNPVKNPFATDADGDTLTYGVVTAPAEGTATAQAGGILYQSTNTTSGVWDSFEYSVDDGFGGAATNTMAIYITGAQGANLLSATNSGGMAYLTYLGIPGVSYVSERATNLAIVPIEWTPVGTNTAGAANGPTPGVFSFTNQILSPASFFRTQAE
jgi:hypothetical protein